MNMPAGVIRRLAPTISLMALAGCGATAAVSGTGGAVSPAAATSPASTPSPTASTVPVVTLAPTPVPPTAPPRTNAPRTAVPPAMTPAPARPMPTARPAVGPVLVTETTTMGAALAAGSNGRTLYTYNTDMAGSGQTACNAGCVNEWPPLIVPHGTMASVGAGVMGRLGTMVRGDGTTQVTYNGLALYFYAGDSGPDQTNGAYPGWSLTKP
jgi:predicted lipoprotein with Yx(FWY)xxD motif